MKTLVTTLSAIVVLAVCGTAALAANFECTVSKAGSYYTYTLRNNHASYDIVEWHLCWNADDDLNAPFVAANFTRSDASYISIPAQWFRTDDPNTEPRMFTDDPPTGSPIMHGGNLKSFTIKYKSSSSTPAPLFRVGCTENNVWMGWGDCMPVPEPGSMLVLLGGLAGSGLFLRRRSA